MSGAEYKEETVTRDRFQGMAQLSASQLERLLRGSKGPDIDSLVGFEWRGWNTGWQTRLLGIQKFVKGCFRAGGGVEGYNIPVVQSGPDAAWQHLPAPENPKRYAFYRVTRVNPEAADNFYPEALLLDYGASSRNAEAPYVARLLRDYVVQPDPASPDLLLGKAYLAFGLLRIPSNFFILERLRPTTWLP